MCTCIMMKTEDVYFGRTMDIHYRFGEQPAVTPRGYRFPLRSGGELRTRYAMIGMATVLSGYPLYAEASNEKGLCIAGLNFPDTAWYGAPVPGRRNLAPYELIPWVLGSFATVEEAERELSGVFITDTPFGPDIPTAPLHWMLGDAAGGCIVIEQTKEEGLKIYDDPYGVLTNNPVFPFHRMNLNNYINLTPQPPQNRFCRDPKLVPFGAGMGSIGLPGDTSSTSRFVRACFNKLNSVCTGGDEASVSQFFHILDSVSLVRGSTLLQDSVCSVTLYSCCVNAGKGVYYYKTYGNSQLTALRLTDENINSHKLTLFPLEERQQVRYMN